MKTGGHASEWHSRGVVASVLMGMFTIEEFSGRIVDLTHPPRTTLTLSISWEGLDHTPGPLRCRRGAPPPKHHGQQGLILLVRRIRSTSGVCLWAAALSQPSDVQASRSRN